jgi:hypothetical protein
MGAIPRPRAKQKAAIYKLQKELDSDKENNL